MSPVCHAWRNAEGICSASCAAEFPDGTKPVEFALPPGATTVTITAAIPARRASTPAVTATMTLRRFPRRPPPDGRDGPDATAGKGAVEGSDANQGPDDRLLL